MNTDQLLRSAVSKLGPIAAANALTAFETGERGSWTNCVLARAYGADGELQRDAHAQGRAPTFLALEALKLTLEEAAEISSIFDNQLARPAATVLLRSLLEGEASKLTTVPSPARGSAEGTEAAPDSLALVSR